MSKSLPARPSVEQLKKQAKELLHALKAGEPAAVRRYGEHHPDGGRPVQAAGLSLADAQLVLAREYGFSSWAKLRDGVRTLLLDTLAPVELLRNAFHEDDAPLLSALLERHPELKARINDRVAPFDSPAIIHARSREMLDVLLAAGADINAKSRWWAGGFGLLDQIPPELADYAIEWGALVDIHAAARLGRIDHLREPLAADPDLVHARGGDGQTPLHVAATVEVAELLLAHGADIDARDIDHESTPAQYMARDRPQVARYLIARGCRTDLLLAAALGDIERVRGHLDSDPESVRMRVNDEYFPKQNPRSGGTIYQWTLGWHVSAHDVAREFGHREISQLLMERSPPDVKLIAACWAGEDERVRSLQAEHPALSQTLSPADRCQVAHAARNNQTTAVRLMLDAGLPVDARGQHNATPLHWAAFHGNADMSRVVLRHAPPLEAVDRDFRATPLGWAIHGSEHGWHAATGDYAQTVALLLEAGAKIPPNTTGGTQAVRETLQRSSA